MKSIQTISCPLIRLPFIALCILSLSLVGCGSDDDNATSALACILLLPICLLAGKSASQPDDSEFVSMPDNLRVDYDDSNIAGSTFHLSWDMPPENVKYDRYEITRNGATIAIVNETSYSDTGVNDNSEYCYSVVAIDENGNRLSASRPVCKTTSWKITRIANAGKLISLDLDSSDHAYIWQVESNDNKSDYKKWLLSTNQSGQWNQVSNPIDKDTGRQSPVIDDSYSFQQTFVDSGKINYIKNRSGYWKNELVPYWLYTTDTAGAVSLIDNGSDDPQACISYPEAESLGYASKVANKWVFQELAVVTSHGCQLALDSSGSAHISYVDSNNGYLMHMTNASGVWDAQIVDDGNIYPHHSITLAYVDNVYIAYYDAVSGELRVADNATGVWFRQSLGVPSGSLYSPAMVSDSAGRQHLAYQDESSLKYATNISGTWQIYTIDGQDLINSFDIVIDSLDKVHIAYGWGAKDSQNITYLTNR